MRRTMELGVHTFGDVGLDPRTGRPLDPGRRLRDLVEEIELADQVGLDVFGVGEHHRPDFAVSTPAVALAAAAERTERIRLTSAVSVISSDDPVRVFQRFSTLDAVSNGRAEVILGRGSFTESFPLFGLDLAIGRWASNVNRERSRCVGHQDETAETSRIAEAQVEWEWRRWALAVRSSFLF